MNISELIKEAHGNAIERGFYECDCNEGRGYSMDCSICNGTGIINNKNIGELLMLVVSELGEALEAHRCGQFANWDKYTKEAWDRIGNGDLTCASAVFEEYVKESFEDEIIDAKIRCFALMGYLDIEWKEIFPYLIVWKSDNAAQKIRQVCKYFDNLDEDNLTNYDLITGAMYIDHLAESFNIPIEKYIKAKMSYNRTRPHKHGKEY